MEQGIEASQLRIAAFGEYLIQALSVELRLIGKPRHSGVGFCPFRDASRNNSDSPSSAAFETNRDILATRWLEIALSQPLA